MREYENTKKKLHPGRDAVELLALFRALQHLALGRGHRLERAFALPQVVRTAFGDVRMQCERTHGDCECGEVRRPAEYCDESADKTTTHDSSCAALYFAYSSEVRTNSALALLRCVAKSSCSAGDLAKSSRLRSSSASSMAAQAASSAIA